MKNEKFNLQDYTELIDFTNIKLTPSLAIKLKCKECCAFNSKEVAKCENTSCPLHQFTHNKRKRNISDEDRERRRNLIKQIHAKNNNRNNYPISA